jgi:hypothetical protein
VAQPTKPGTNLFRHDCFHIHKAANIEENSKSVFNEVLWLPVQKSIAKPSAALSRRRSLVPRVLTPSQEDNPGEIP